MQRVTILLLTAFLFTGLATESHAQSPGDSSAFVQDLADRAIANLTEPGLSDVERETRFRELFREGFAIHGIAKFTLGRHWRTASKEERSEYLTLFEDVVVDNWAARFTKYSGQRFEIRDESKIAGAANENVVIVKSLVWTSPETPIRVNWRVANAGEIYKITDVIIEGVSMANTQRDEFASLVRKNGLAGLLESLRKKSGQPSKLAKLVDSQQYEILPASGDTPDLRQPDMVAQEPAPMQPGTLAIQLASMRSSERARLAWKRLLAKYPAMLGNYTLSLERVDLNERGVFYRVRTGAFALYADAARTCQRFADLDQDCLVVQR